jgi:hypothetical protein
VEVLDAGGQQMTRADGLDTAAGGTPAALRPKYTAAIYGSLLAASVVVGAAVGRHGRYELPPVRLAALIVVTGVVFWLAHAYARLVGDRLQRVAFSAAEIRVVVREEWPLLEAALRPAAAAVVFGLLGASDAAAAWAALTVAIAGQVGWATVATVRAGASRRLVVLSAVVNLVLGLLIVALKVALHH